MAHVEFKFMDTRFFGKTPDEITAILNKNAEKAKKIAENGGFDPNQQRVSQFPKWLRKLLHAAAEKENSKAVWDSVNDSYSIRVNGDLPDVDDFYHEFFAQYEAMYKGDEEKEKWVLANPLRAFITESDGSEEMADLEAHHRSAAVRPERKEPGEDK